MRREDQEREARRAAAIDGLRRESEERWDELREQRVMLALRERSAARAKGGASGTGRRWALLGVALAAAAAGVLALRERSADVAEEQARASARRAPEVQLADGSIVVLGDEARVQVEEETEARVCLRHDAGLATYHVSRRPERVFEVRAAGTVVRVRGTVFDVQVDAQGVEVRVHEGRVEVDDGARQTLLVGGELLRVRRDPDRAPPREAATGAAALEAVGTDATSADAVTADAVTADAVTADAVTADAVTADAVTADAVTADAVPMREAVADERPHRVARRAETAELPPPRTEAEAPEADLLEAADRARREHRLDEAAELLIRAEREARSATSRATAAQMLARVESSRGDVRAAAEAFDRCARADADGALAEGSVAGAARAWLAAEDRPTAVQRARDYLARWPNGVHAASMRRIAEE